MKKALIGLGICLLAARGIGADIKHTFLATDESRKQLLYVDQFNPAADWTIPLKGNRDIQLLSEERFIVSVPTGYREYEVKTGKLINEVKVGGGIRSAVRAEDGHTFVANSGTIWELDPDNKIINTLAIDMGGYFRLLRLSKSGNYLFTGGATVVKEADRSGKVIREFDLSTLASGAKKPYFMMQLKNGNYMVSTGFGADLLFLNEKGELLRSLGGKKNITDVFLMFFAAAEVLPNGNVMVANWTGHKPDDSRKGPQVLEFDEDGKIVWMWHDAERAGTIHGIAVIR